MNKSRQLLSGFLLVAFLFVFAQVAIAAGTVSNCTEADLRAALAGGGGVTITCTSTITVTQTLIIGGTPTAITGNPNASISGGKSVAVFAVNPGAVLVLGHVQIEQGQANLE